MDDVEILVIGKNGQNFEEEKAEIAHDILNDNIIMNSFMNDI